MPRRPPSRVTFVYSFLWPCLFLREGEKETRVLLRRSDATTKGRRDSARPFGAGNTRPPQKESATESRGAKHGRDGAKGRGDGAESGRCNAKGRRGDTESGRRNAIRKRRGHGAKGRRRDAVRDGRCNAVRGHGAKGRRRDTVRDGRGYGHGGCGDNAIVVEDGSDSKG